MLGASGVSILKSFLQHPGRPAGTLRYHELQGFLFAVASVPELVRPSEWMPIVFGDRDAGYLSLDEARTILGELMALYNSVNAAVAADHATLPADCRFRREAQANLDDAAPIAEWSRGFMRGHQWLEESWEPYVPADFDDEFAAILLTLSFFASRDVADAFRAETGQTDLAAMSKTIRRVFPNAVAEYARLGRSIHRVLMENQAAETKPPRSVKVGRNEPCPCRSGRTYKVCCAGRV
jgi:uncharacterized protein